MNDLNSIQVNPLLLSWAREMCALSPHKAAEETSINLERLLQLENGEKQPSIAELKAMSKSYKLTIATLLLKERPVEKPLPQDRRTVDSKELDSFHFKTIMAVRKARALLESLIELKQEFSLPIQRMHINAALRDSAVDLAKKIRQDLQLDGVRQFDNLNNALDAYIEKVESLGVAIFQLSLTQDNLRGFSLVDETIPVIVIKRNDQASAKIFTLFHELGHIILNDGGICDININQNAQQIEKWCNAFAANLLIPAGELLNMEIVKKQISSGQMLWLKKDLISLANHFQVGPLAILRSLLEQKLTTIEFYQEKHLSWNKPSFGRAKEHEGRNIAKETIREKGRTYINLAFRAYDQNKIGLKDLSDFLGVKLSYIPKTRQLLSAI